MKRLDKYFDLMKYFLHETDNISDVIYELRQTQIYLGELIYLKSDYRRKLAHLNRKYHVIYETARATIFDIMQKRGTTATESIIKAKIEIANGEELNELRDEIDDYTCLIEATQDLYYAMMQRKDVLSNIISVWNVKDGFDAMLKNHDRELEYINLETGAV